MASYLQVENISKSYGDRTLFSNISFNINEGDKIALVAPNGTGKSSLMKILAGVESSDRGGEVKFLKDIRVAFLDQNFDFNPKNTIVEEVYNRMGAIAPEIQEYERALASGDSGRLERAIASMDASGSWDIEQNIKQVLSQLKIERLDQPMGELSGGEAKRVALACMMLQNADFLIMDEPTNHLDIDALAWLESFIASYKKTVIIISHDRYFLDRTTNKTLHIQYSSAKLYNGNYTATREMQEKEAASLEKRYREQQKEIAKIRANIEFQRRCNREHNFVTIRSKEKQLARMEKVELAPPPPKDIRLSFNAEPESAGDVLEVKDLSFSYGGAPLIKGISFLVRKYERVLILGRNGSGKSTLMKLINSMLIPSAGKLTLGYNIKIGYYDQENRGLSLNKTVFEELHDAYPEKKDGELRSVLALFLFGADDIIKPISVLSGGERARLTLAKLMLKRVNLLIMDEPTNHLDIGSAEALENALLAFDGTIIAVSHDRYFINRIATRIIELDASRERGLIDYQLEDYDDAFTEYMRLREASRTSVEKTAKVQESSSKLDYEQRKRENAERRAEEKRLSEAKKKIEKLENELVMLEDELFGEAATNYERASEIEERKSEIEEELLALYEIVM